MTPPRFTVEPVPNVPDWGMVIDWEPPRHGDGVGTPRLDRAPDGQRVHRVVALVAPEYSKMADLLVEQLFALAKTSAVALREPPDGG